MSLLTQATWPLVANPNETFSYDSVGNRLNRDTQTTNSTFDAGNRLLSDANFNYTYDNNGNMTSKTNIITNQTISFVYDAENQLIQINLSNGDVANYKYDGLGRRIEKSVVGSLLSVVRYVYDNEDIAFEFDGGNNLTASYVHGPGIDEPLAMKRGGSDYFYHTDGLGSITDLTDTAGIIAQSYVYDSFGNIVNQTGSLANPYIYTGRELDAESGLYYYRARYYDPTIGRFLQEDPFGIKTRQRAPKTLRDDFESMENIRPWLTKSQKQNDYLYTTNSPASFNDPTGLDNPQNDPRYLKCIEELELLKLSCSMKKTYDPKCWINFKLKSEECALIALNIIRKRPEEFKGPTPECPQDTYQLPSGI